MLSIIFYLVVFGSFRAYRRLRTRRPRGMCAGCTFVHMQYGAAGRNAVFCTFGGVVRPVQIEVLYCTDYRDRSVPERLVRIGFARSSHETEKSQTLIGNAVVET
jgi:hypothetical protein